MTAEERAAIGRIREHLKALSVRDWDSVSDEDLMERCGSVLELCRRSGTSVDEMMRALAVLTNPPFSVADFARMSARVAPAGRRAGSNKA